MVKPTVYVAHCVDTEGPLHESLEATFERLRHIFHLDLEPSRATLRQLQQGEIDLGGITASVKAVVSPRVLGYNDTWDKIGKMLDEAMSPAFRLKQADSRGQGWVFNWFCLDHVGYEVNPRRRDMGYHNIFDHYRSMLREHGPTRDGMHFHFHPQPLLPHAHLCATHWWAASDKLYKTLSRRIIDRLWFPAVNRPGFQVNRPDSHWFLEQFIPFDYASMAVRHEVEDTNQLDFSAGRSGDWRRAPLTWEPYRPAHDDYQSPGACRRWISRCLPVGTRAYNLDQVEVDRGFAEAREGKAVVLSFSDHDFRDIRRDVRDVQKMLRSARRRFPDVDYVYCEAAQAMRRALRLPQLPPCALDLELMPVGTAAHMLRVRCAAPPFGPQPYLALKTRTQTYLHDNFDFQVPGREWSYTFDGETLPLAALESIGVAVNTPTGVTTVARLDVASGRVETVHHNLDEGD